MALVPAFNSNQLEAVCRVLADTDRGLTGSEIGHLLDQLGFPDPDPSSTKWKRLYNALAEKQNADGHATNVCRFIEVAMDPVRFVGQKSKFEERRDELNKVIAFMGCSVGSDGKLRKAETVATIDEAEQRANRLRTELQRRNVHHDVLSVCQARFLQRDYFYAILEAAKSIREKIRQKSGLGGDGAALIDLAFEKGTFDYPLLAFNSLQSDSDRNEHRGIVNLMRGVFSAFRNPTAHEPEHVWPINEQDALDVLTTASFIHRRLDKAVKTR